MMENSKFAADLATLLRSGLQRDERRMPEASLAFKRLNADTEARAATGEFMKEMGLKAFENRSKSKVYLVPNDSDSMFAMKTTDARGRINSDAKSAMLAFGFLLALGTFYPSRSVLNQGTRLGITVDDVFSTASKIIDIANRDKEIHGNKAATLADEWQNMPERDNSKGTKVAFQEYYILTALKLLQEYKMATHSESENRWYPTDRLATTVVMRFDGPGTIAAEMVSALQEQNEGE